jgi:hypothetical protein
VPPSLTVAPSGNGLPGSAETGGPATVSSPAARAHAPDDVPDGINRSVTAADHVGDKPRPAGLVEGADRGAVIAVEVLAEDQVVVPGRIVLQPLGPAEAGPPSVGAAGEDRDQPVLQVGGDLVQGDV